MYATVPTTVPASVWTIRVGSAPSRTASAAQLREAEVQHLDHPVRPEHHVLGLDVAVDDPGRVRGAQRRGHLDGDVERLTQAEAPRQAVVAACRPRRTPSR